MFTKLLAAINAIKKSNAMLSRTEKTFMFPSAAAPAKVGTIHVMAAQVVLNNSQRD
jgi:hypothetical protein